jgi:polygalacturonase
MRLAALIIAALLTISPLLSQSPSTVATGDSRVVTEPTALLNSATICAKVPATKWMQKTTAVSLDPGSPTCGSTGGINGVIGCTGATSYEPSSSNAGYIAAESLDNAGIQAAFNSCPAGQAVELTQGTAGQNAFVLKPINAVNSSGQGIYVLGDMGISVNASRNPSDYGGSSCGKLSTSSSTQCANSWLSETGSGGGYIGYANWYARSWDAFYPSNGQPYPSFYSQRLISYCAIHGGTTEGSWDCPSGLPAYQNAYGPNALNFVGASNCTVYKMTVRDSGNFISNLQNVNGCTYWDAKLFAPFNVSNTDMWDTISSQNVTFTKGYLSGGDNIAFKASAGAASCKSGSSGDHNLTLSYSQIGAAIAISFGTCVIDGISNVLITGNVGNGNSFRSNDRFEEIGSDGSGNVNVVTYENNCVRNYPSNVQFKASGTTSINNLGLFNNTFLPSTAPYTTGQFGTFEFKGTSSNQLGMQLNNFQIDGTLPSGAVTAKDASIYLGPGSVDSTLQSQLACGSNGVVCAGTPSSTPAYTCSNASWQPLNLESNLQTATVNNNQSVTNSGPITLAVNVQPVTAINEKESAALTAGVQFYDNGAALGSPVALSRDNTYASYTVSSVPSGTNNYTACYVGDSNYSRFCGSAMVTAINGSPSAPVPSTATGNVQFSGNILWQ